MEYAKLFVDHVFWVHGLPKVIISDWDPHFTGKFWKSLFDLLGIDLRFSTAFHLKIDGQSERMIQAMENSLRSYVERRFASWSQHLALAEFATNNAINMTIGYTPFFLNSGDLPIIPSILLHSRNVSSHVEAVQTMVNRMKTAREEAQANLSIGANQAKAHADTSQREEKYEFGNEMVLAIRHLHVNEHLLVKLRRRWIGLLPRCHCSIAKVISLVAYQLNLPPN